MATLIELENEKEVYKLDPALSWREQEMRCIYALPRVREWIEEVLPSVVSDRFTEEDPMMQVDSLLSEFCRGDPLPINQKFRALVHLGDGVWELKTADVRLFGWFYRKDCFVISDCDTKHRLLKYNLYKQYCIQSVRFRDGLNLDSPKFVEGDDPNDVISDCYFA
jgi:hypothetical protein